MSKLKQLLILSLFAATIWSACSKNESPIDEKPDPDTAPKVSIIISGGKFKTNTPNAFADSIPAYWVDGIEKTLPNFKMTGLYSISTAIAISKTGKLHFITAGKNNAAIGVSQYWIDGVEQTLPSTLTGEIKYLAATMQNEKFNLIGHDYNRYKYWVDGVEQSLPGNVKELTDIALSTDGVYVGFAGQSNSRLGMFSIKGAVNEISDMSIANNIGIYEGDVYFVGVGAGSNSSRILKYSAGGIKHDLPNSNHDFSMSRLAVSNGKVHVIAELYRVGNISPKYWIDGVEQSLPKGATQLNDITVFEGKVYILGLASGKPTYWIDGVSYELPSSVGYANKIIVTKK